MQVEKVRIETLLDVVRSEVAFARRLLLDYELGAGLSDDLSETQRTHAQGLDLAIQLLGDVEQLASIVGRQLPEDLDQEYALPHTSIRLERVRAKLIDNADISPDPVRSVDLF